MNTTTTKGAALTRLLPLPSLTSPLFLVLFALLAVAVFSPKNLLFGQEGPNLQLAPNFEGFRPPQCLFSSALAPEALVFSLFHRPPASDLTVHEWGTFTSIAGPDGHAMDWLPLTGSTELPNFVEHFRDVQFKGGLRGSIRMETPVLYFYSPRETTISVDVIFPRGLITEWYPHADTVNPLLTTRDFSLYNLKSPGSISWHSVHIDPRAASDFPEDNSQNHYYAARQTSSAPLELQALSGPQREKFLFYRGVAAFPPPLTATISPDGTVSLQNYLSTVVAFGGSELPLRQFAAEIPDVILFEHRGAQLGYRILGPLRDQASLSPPALDGSLDSLSSDLEGILISQGLFPDEAHAMLETWKNSWFEEGSRLIYIAPRAFVDSVLPLNIKPAPANTTRVFVGRVELVTPATQQAVESAFSQNDRATLTRYDRFLSPILSFMIQQSSDESRQKLLLRYINAATAMALAQSQ
jgi:hypothetical protein